MNREYTLKHHFRMCIPICHLYVLKRKTYMRAIFNSYVGSILTCYFRHLGGVFQEAGIIVTSENRKEIDKIIQRVVGTEGKHCPEVWAEVKKCIKENNSEFVEELKSAWKNRE